MKVCLLVNKNHKIECVGEPRENCINTPARQAILADGGLLIDNVNEDDFVIGDNYNNNVHKKDSPERKKQKDKKDKEKVDTSSGVAKLKSTVGLVDDEIKAMWGDMIIS